MANRKNTFLLKRSNVAGNIPVAGQIELGELALNTADVKLYASGTTTNSILQIGWDRVSRTGDTMTGALYLPTISATTYQNLPLDIRVTGGTYAAGTTTFTNNTGGTFNVAGYYTGFNGGVVSGITATTTSVFNGSLILNGTSLRASPYEFYGEVALSSALDGTNNTAYINIGTFSDSFTHIVVEVKLVPWLLNTVNIGTYTKVYVIRMTSASPGIVTLYGTQVTEDIGTTGDKYQIGTPIANASNLLQIPVHYIGTGSGNGNPVTAYIRVRGNIVGNLDKVSLSAGTPTVVTGGTQEYTSIRNRLGINTLFPTSNLEVVGTTRLSGNTIVNGSLTASTMSAVTYNGYLPATQDGTVLYSPTKSFTPTGTVSTSNMTVTSIGTQFNNTMIGAKLIISGDSRIITGYTSTTVVTVDRPYTQNYSAVAAGDWGVYFKVFEIPASGYPNFYLGNQSGGAPPGTVFLSNNAGFVNTQYAFTQGTNSFYGDTTNYSRNGYIVWAPGTSFDKFGTSNDLGIRRNSAGVLEVFDGWTFSGLTSRRDLLVRNFTASTISATTYQNLPTDVYVTGGTYSSGVATFRNTTGGTFNVNGFFTGGTPSVSFTQSSPATGWTFTHNLGIEKPLVTVYNSSNQVIIPQEITAVSLTTLYITFPVPVSGYAIAAGGVVTQQTEEINIITSIIFG